MIAVYIIEYIFIAYLGFASLYIFVFGFAGLFGLKQKQKPISKQRRFAVMIPGYKEDEVIVDVAREASQQNYPDDRFDVIVIADSFMADTLASLQKLPIKVIEVSFESSTKSKALNKAMAQLPEDYDVAVVLDADNVMEEDFLNKMNMAFEGEVYAVQGHRIAKNTNTSFAVLDAVSEEINNNIFRKGHRVLGLSAAIIGSGMGLRYRYFKNLMKNIHAIGGFDKEIELRMLKEGKIIEYLNHAFVYDEKVQKADVFSNQRRRWLSAQLHYFSKDFFTALKHLIKKGNIDYFDKAMQFIQPPRIMLLGILIIISILSVIFNPLHFTIFWLSITAICILAFFFCIPTRFYNMKTLKALLTLPRGFLLMFGSLLKIRGANKKFIHTQHTSTEIDKNKTKTP
ncbi:MAG: glycosyltransferase family 2 protein [Bacteroidales bacterium]|nr:glycosyltransferase family 2 protein [Bacteroidales bacterium]MCF8343873.1 glycosyltransferase family 2 protein [Bacteroidales bacterium]MCF8351881.1 glycosyltransferase family 2 protein [Bacteroidales bacterium]MCF8375254.1 glycosyltransferase family 2 protein [Bacteroidales bacterium]MCF8400278.1 glycosyltransferase family 2 protein [Bacteroidales bacterium]